VSDSLEHAPEHVKLAVDLIMLLEQHELDPNTILMALEIVKLDVIKQRDLGGNPTSHIPAHTS